MNQQDQQDIEGWTVIFCVVLAVALLAPFAPWAIVFVFRALLGFMSGL